jgi:hypothetical protein
VLGDNNNEFKLTITQDKLVDILLHAATREDIAKLDAKIDSLETKIDAKIDSLEAKMDSKINNLDVKMDAIRSELESKINSLDIKMDSKFDKIIFGIVLAILVPIIIQLCSHFLK